MTAVLDPVTAEVGETKPEPIVITRPGVYPDLPEDVYHADPVPGGSLSSSGARRLWECPAKYRYEQDNPRKSKKEFDFGRAAHQLVLGRGGGIVEVSYDSYRTNAAKEERDSAYAAGMTPLLPKEMAEVDAMADAIRRHPVAGRLFDPDRGQPEVSLFWRDQRTGVKLRARFDWMPERVPGRRLIVPDYKTTRSADPSKFDKSIADYGYHQQSDWYLNGARALDLADDDAQFVFVAQEKTAPYVVTVIQLDPTAMAIGRFLNREAIQLYKECVDSGVWPGYRDDDIAILGLPPYIERQFDDEEIYRD